MSATIHGNKIEVKRGEDASFSLHAKNFEFDDDSQIIFTVRRRADAKQRIIHKEVSTGDRDEDGKVWVRINREDTLELDFGVYRYDMWLIVNGKNKPLITDAPFIVGAEVRDLKGGIE